ncbi:glycosyltransferase family 4 protein [Butyrivibrio sp.]|jgi:glycosyltransferase involved in cell wall biosynthesis|uniref:glycosyltransferase family 4 protein n=1 Tax=Butyrivibrio sp. TaxID=28121 RepID=UPI0025C2A7BD|nr:glycosyltransferase family 4 protein [Butyrivibrio sp.]MBE5838864.1 glycosyltransferase family 4 protein [Butyrivibrio sp.]
MKIRKILLEIYSLENAGAQHMISDLAVYYKQKGLDVCLVVLEKSPENALSKELLLNGVKIVYGSNDDIWIKKKIRQYITLKTTVDKFKPDVIHGNTEYRCLWLYALIHGKTFVETFHSQAFRLNNWRTVLLFKILHKKKLIVPVVLSPINAREYVELFKLHNEELEIIPNPIVLEHFIKRKYKDKQEVVFGLAARFNSIKRHDLLISAFSILIKEGYDCQLILAGEGDTIADIKELVKSYNLQDRVKFLGDISDVSLFLDEVDVGVMSSDSECFPIFLLECMAKGIPVIATGVGGVPDIIKDNGIIVEKGKDVQLAKAMEELASSSEKRKQKGEKGRIYASEYDVRWVAEKYLSVYEKVDKK